jgi:hypothetical protein
MAPNLVKLMQAMKRILWVGKPGCAKTARVLATCDAAGFELELFRASLSDRVDLGGALVPDIDGGITRALPLAQLHRLQTTKKPTCLFIDDLGQAPMDVQAACMSLFDKGALSPSVVIWGATNRPGDKAGVTALCEPLRSRFQLAFGIPGHDTTDQADGISYISTWQEELDGWCDWALDSGLPPELVAYHRFTGGQHLHTWQPNADPARRSCDYRSWHTVGELVQLGLADLTHLGAAIGKADAASYIAFANLTDALPSPDQVWIDPTGAPVPADPSALYLIATSLAAVAELKHAAPLMTYVQRLPRVAGALCARDAFRRLGQPLAKTKEWAVWYRENSALFTSK